VAKTDKILVKGRAERSRGERCDDQGVSARKNAEGASLVSEKSFFGVQSDFECPSLVSGPKVLPCDLTTHINN